MNISQLETGTTTDQKIALFLGKIASLDSDSLSALITDKGCQFEGDLFIKGIAQSLLAGDTKGLDQLLSRSKSIKHPYLVLLKRACQYLCAGRAVEVIKTVIELETMGIVNPLCFVLAAEAQFLNNQYTEAFHNFSTAAKKIVFNDYLTIKSRYCLQYIEATKYSLPLETGAMDYLKDHRFDSAAISPLVASLLKLKYKLQPDCKETTLESLHYSQVTQDLFFLEALPRLLLPDPDIELFLIKIRSFYLNALTQAVELTASHFQLLCALSMQACLNEHVHFITDSEAESVSVVQESINHVLNQPSFSTNQIAGLVLLTSLYEPLSEQVYYSKLLQLPKDKWPPEILPCLERILYQPEKELEFVESIPCLTPINNEISLLVGGQYEANPYPRWIEVNQVENSKGYTKYNKINKPPFLQAKHFDKPIKMLIAGCGTGKHPISLALKFPDIQITAIDLSRRSLAYAKMMAEKFGVLNIRFYQADILELSALEERFNVIECMGVLHHMQDPLAGLDILKGLLIKQGVIKLGLYSEIARTEIASFRAENLLSPTRHNIRRTRHSAINENREKYEDCLKSNDFYSMSMCRDLLFHSQEHTFSLKKLEPILKKNRLLFKGFTFNTQQTFKQFQMSHPSASKLLDLQAWHQFEKHNPLTFAGMYQFFAQMY